MILREKKEAERSPWRLIVSRVSKEEAASETAHML
jgi:hypothetical protein